MTYADQFPDCAEKRLTLEGESASFITQYALRQTLDRIKATPVHSAEEQMAIDEDLFKLRYESPKSYEKALALYNEGTELANNVINGLKLGEWSAHTVTLTEFDERYDGFIRTMGSTLCRIRDLDLVTESGCCVSIDEVMSEEDLSEDERTRGILLPAVRVRFMFPDEM